MRLRVSGSRNRGGRIILHARCKRGGGNVWSPTPGLCGQAPECWWHQSDCRFTKVYMGMVSRGSSRDCNARIRWSYLDLMIFALLPEKWATREMGYQEPCRKQETILQEYMYISGRDTSEWKVDRCAIMLFLWCSTNYSVEIQKCSFTMVVSGLL